MINIEIEYLKIAKETEKICLERGLTIEEALKKIARDYSEGMRKCQKLNG